MMQNKLKDILKAKGLSQKDFATMMGVTQQYISGVCRNALGVSIQQLQLFADRLGVSITDLLDLQTTGMTLTCPHCGLPIMIDTIKAGE